MAKFKRKCVECKTDFTFDDSKITSRTSDILPGYPEDLPTKCILCGGDLE